MKKVLVIDLDGTLFSINTFHFWIKFLILNAFKRFNISLFFKIIFSCSLRLFRLISHSKMKYLILNATKNQSSIDNHKFIKSIQQYTNDLSKFIEDDSYEIKILATAAPMSYASIISNIYNFNSCIATGNPIDKLSWKENLKEVKKDNVLLYLNKFNINKIDTLITDHFDDLPLMQHSLNTILIAPTSSTTAFLKKEAIPYTIIKK